MDAYQDWIEKNVARAYGACAEATVAMVLAFPELRRVRGHYVSLDPRWGRREHWWCVEPDGSIVDPTASQFPCGGMGDYKEWSEGDEEPTGKCPNCGNYCYAGRAVYSDWCGMEYDRYLRTGEL